MDFWARQAEARQRSRWLILVFVVAVLAVVVAVNVVVLALFAVFDSGQVADTAWVARHPQAVTVATLAVLAVVAIANLYKTLSLSSGGGVVARSLGGMRVQADTRDPLQRRLLNVVEEMAIASGVPVPAVYVLEQEAGINAFAAGHTSANAAIAVTRGALEHLNRAELQGVIGHEFSHILNGDMRLNIRLMGLLFGLLVIAIAGRTVSWHAPRRVGRRRGDGAGMLLLAGFAVMALGYIGVFFGRLIQAAVSRQREFLADASSVQFTRDAAGLRNALVKIGSVEGSRIRHPDAEEVAHMLFAPGMTRWFATHPPLVERIRALDPSFDPAEFRDLRLEVKPQPLGVVSVVDEPLPKSFSDPEVLSRQFVPVDPAEVPGRVANPGAREVGYARTLRESLPQAWLSSNGDRAGAAAALLLTLVLDTAPAVRSIQMQRIRASMGEEFETLVDEQIPRVERLLPEQRLPLLGQIVPRLRGLPRETRARILDCLSLLCRADGQIAIFEYALSALAQLYLREMLEPLRQARPVQLRHVIAELQVVFSTLAEQGHASDEARGLAYAQGVARVGLELPPPFRPVPGWAGALDRALRCLDGLSPPEKARVIEGLAATVVHDGKVTITEGELLRAICAMLHCPLPPLAERG
jgi:Zn-dependent protease with chaperone function